MIMVTRICLCFALLFALAAPVVAAPVDAGTPALADAATQPAAAPASVTAESPPEDLARAAYRGVTSKNWFLLAGAALALLALGARWALAKKWPNVQKKIYGVAIVAALAGVGGLANAWLADAPIASSLTLFGALKVWMAAAWLYVTTKAVLPRATANGN